MSAELESNKEEEEKTQPEPQPQRFLRYHVQRYWPIGFKLLELVLAAICMGFIYEPVATTGLASKQLHHIGVMYTTYTGSMLIIIGLLIGRLLQDRLGFKTSFVFSITSAALYLVTGILLAVDKTDLTKDHFFHPSRYLLIMMNVSIYVSFLTAIVHIVDGVMTFIRKQDF